MYYISKLRTRVDSIKPTIVFLWLFLFSLTLSSSWPVLLLTVSCLCLYCDLLWHSQHISVAAIKIAQKIIINIVGYNKKKRNCSDLYLMHVVFRRILHFTFLAP